jgi:phosphorylase kinase alpha/beta subunit
LGAILPSECVQPSPRQNRRYDAALLFLVYPLGVVAPPMADQILSDIDHFLQGEVGMRRYLGDSYWAPDYDERLPPEDLCRDFSQDMETRDVLLERIGDEAQWCIFDPILSAYYGQRFRESAAAGDLDRQTHHFERALAHVTPAWQCPELYYRKHGAFAQSPHAPLLWTQANLTIALSAIRASVASR